MPKMCRNRMKIDEYNHAPSEKDAYLSIISAARVNLQLCDSAEKAVSQKTIIYGFLLLFLGQFAFASPLQCRHIKKTRAPLIKNGKGGPEIKG